MDSDKVLWFDSAMQLGVTWNVHTSKNDQIRVVLRVIHSDKKWTVVVLNLIVHINIKSFQYASVVLIKVLIDPSKYLDHPRKFCKK